MKRPTVQQLNCVARLVREIGADINDYPFIYMDIQELSEFIWALKAKLYGERRWRHGRIHTVQKD